MSTHLTTEQDDAAAYTWESAARDLAMLTSLTLAESGRLVREITSRHPNLSAYDALPALRRLLDHLTGPIDGARAGHALAVLLDGAARPGPPPVAVDQLIAAGCTCSKSAVDRCPVHGDLDDQATALRARLDTDRNDPARRDLYAALQDYRNRHRATRSTSL